MARRGGEGDMIVLIEKGEKYGSVNNLFLFFFFSNKEKKKKSNSFFKMKSQPEKEKRFKS